MRVPRSVVVVVVVVGLLAGGAGPAAAAVPCSKGNVALTFDDGPRLPYTATILDRLKAKRAPATFFVVGSVADRQPALLKRAHAEGHQVGNHSWSHPKLSSLSDASIRSQLKRTNDEIRSHGLPAPKVMRPPYGATNARVRNVAASLGLAHVLWTIDTNDWRSGRTATAITNAALSKLHSGANILMHDGVGNSGATATAVPRIIDGARNAGYCIGVLDAAGKVVPATPKVHIADAKVTEGAAGTKTTMSFAVTLSVPTSRKVTVAWATANGNAVAGADFTARSGTVTFAPGAWRATVSVPVLGDNLDEVNETFQVNLSKPAAATIARAAAKGTIVDDDAAPKVIVDDAKADESVSPAQVAVRLSAPSGKKITMAYATAAGTAKAGVDYVHTAGNLTFSAGQTRKVVPVALIDRLADGPARSFTLSVSSLVNVGSSRPTGTVTVADDPRPAVSVADVAVSEAVGEAVVTLALSAKTKRSVTVTATTEDGTAVAGTDYTATRVSVTFAPGQTAKAVAVPVADDTSHTGDRAFRVVLSAPGNAVIGTGSALVTILEDDPVPAPEGDEEAS